jgi:hypothetical protein
MKTILIPTEQNDAMRSTLKMALLTAQKFSSYIEGYAVRPSIPTVLAMDVAASVSLSSLEAENAEATRQLFETFMREHNVARPRRVQDGPTYGWFEDAPEGENFVGNYGRVFDLTVLGRPT